MRLSMNLSYAGGFKETVQQVVDLEQAGLDVVWVAEAYSFDAISQMGYLAAKTERIQIGSGIVNVYSRTPGADGDDVRRARLRERRPHHLRPRRVRPAGVEGFHGVPYEKPMQRIKEYIEVCRMVWRREVLVYDGKTVQMPLPEGQGTGLGRPLKLINHPVRADIPIWWASLMGLSVAATAELADGWLPVMFIPERADRVWGDDLSAGPGQALARPGAAGDLRRRHRRHRRGPRRRQGRPHPRPGPPRHGAVRRRHGRPRQELLQRRRPPLRLRRRGHRDPGPLPRRQEGRGRGQGAGRVAGEVVAGRPRSYVAERVAALQGGRRHRAQREASGPEAVKTIEQLRSIVDDA